MFVAALGHSRSLIIIVIVISATRFMCENLFAQVFATPLNGCSQQWGSRHSRGTIAKVYSISASHAWPIRAAATSTSTCFCFINFTEIEHNFSFKWKLIFYAHQQKQQQHAGHALLIMSRRAEECKGKSRERMNGRGNMKKGNENEKTF